MSTGCKYEIKEERPHFDLANLIPLIIGGLVYDLHIYVYCGATKVFIHRVLDFRTVGNIGIIHVLVSVSNPNSHEVVIGDGCKSVAVKIDYNTRNDTVT